MRARGGHAVLAPNGVDDEFFAVDGPGDEDRALFFGHFGYEANRRGRRALPRRGLAARPPRAPEARLAGRGSRADARARGRRLDILGLVADLPAVLGAARAVVVPIWEGGGTRLKVLEALAAGREVVSTPLGASGIGFEHGRHGVLAETRRGAGAALAAVLADLTAPLTRRRDGRMLAERFRWKEALAAASALLCRSVARPMSRPIRLSRYRR